MIIITKHPEQLSNPNFKDFQVYNDGKEVIEIIDNAHEAFNHYMYNLREKGRWPEIEEIIRTSPQWAYNYCVHAIKERWPEGEEIIKTHPLWACKYAKFIIKGRWPEAEEVIKTDPMWAYEYAWGVIKGRWPEAEETIKTSPQAAHHYGMEILKYKNWPEEYTNT